LIEGNSKLEATEAMAEMTGPGLGGLLVQAITAPVAIIFDALSFLASAFLLSTETGACDRPRGDIRARGGMKTGHDLAGIPCICQVEAPSQTAQPAPWRFARVFAGPRSDWGTGSSQRFFARVALASFEGKTAQSLSTGIIVSA
jgi:hypothetical protein